MKKTLITLLSLVILSTFPMGCASIKDPQSRVILEITSAAKNGTLIALIEHPEWRPKFESVHAQLGDLIAGGQIESGQISALLNLLPIKELKSPVAQILISEAELRFQYYVGNQTNIEQLAALNEAAKAIHKGMGIALPK